MNPLTEARASCDLDGETQHCPNCERLAAELETARRKVQMLHDATILLRNKAPFAGRLRVRNYRDALRMIEEAGKLK